MYKVGISDSVYKTIFVVMFYLKILLSIPYLGWFRIHPHTIPNYTITHIIEHVIPLMQYIIDLTRVRVIINSLSKCLQLFKNHM